MGGGGLIRRLPVAAVLGLALVATSCGRSEQPHAARAPAPLEDVLRYFHANAAVAVAVPTDLRGAQWRAAERHIVRRAFGRKSSIEGFARELSRGFGYSWRRDIRPMLGNHLVVGTPSARGLLDDEAGVLAALEVRSRPKLLRLLRRQRWLKRIGRYKGIPAWHDSDLGLTVAVDGNVLLASGARYTLRRAIRQRSRTDGLSEARFHTGVSGLPRDALVRAFGNVTATLRHRDLRRFRRMPWVAALRSSSFSLRFEGRRLRAESAVNTDPSRIAASDLPFPPGSTPRALPRRNRQILGASADQSVSTVFMLRSVRNAYPRSRFVRHVRDLERDLAIDFEQDVLKQFAGPSVSVLGLRGRFAARSSVADPAAMAALLPRLAPRLPQLVQDMNRLETPGLSLLLLLAPDAPVAMDRMRGPRVRRLSGPGQLYRLAGLRRGNPPPLNPDAVPPAVVFGLMGDVFVVGSDARRARAMARTPTATVPGLTGASVARADLGRMRRTLRRFLEMDPGRLGALEGSVEASTQQVRSALSLEFR